MEKMAFDFTCLFTRGQRGFAPSGAAVFRHAADRCPAVDGLHSNREFPYGHSKHTYTQ